jgi:hypothetical protein
MKKLLSILTIVSLFLMLMPQMAQASGTLYQCYTSQGLKFPSVSERAIEAAKWGIWNYRGTAEQNTELMNYVCGNTLGFSVATDYAKNLSASMTNTQTFVPVTSITLKDGVALTTASLGGKIFLTIEPGLTKEEIVMCTVVGTLQFTGCTRGLAFSGDTTTGVSANAKTHSAGSPVVLSNVHYVYSQYVDKNTDQTLSGRIYASTTTQVPLTNAEYVTSYYANTLVAGGFSNLNIDTARGLSATGGATEQVGMNLTANQGNLSFDSSGAFSTYVTGTTSEAVNAYAAVVASSTSGGYINSNTTAGNTYDIFKFVGFNASGGVASGTSISIATPGSTLCGFSGTRALSAGAYYYLNGSTGFIKTTSSELVATVASSTNVEMLARVGFALSSSCLRVLQPTYRYSGTLSIAAGVPSHKTYPIITGFYPAHFRVQAAYNTSLGSDWASGIHQSIAEGSPVVGGMYLNVFNSNATGTMWQAEFADIMAWEVNTSTNAYDSEGQIESVTSNGFTFHQYEANGVSVLPMTIRYTVTSE